MSNYNSLILPSIPKNENNCLENYYRYIVGMSMNQQQPTTATTTNNLVNTILNGNDLTQYQKLYVDTLVGNVFEAPHFFILLHKN